ncbi:hypothetical protein NUSPORA_02788 [Nucleospora cyclopteri]
MKELNDQEITEVERTRKIATSKVDAELLNQIDSVIGDYVCLHLHMNFAAVAKCLQAAQCIYWAVCSKRKERSPWKDNILGKIEKHEKSREIVYSVKKSETLSSNKEARKVLRELNFKCNPANIQKAIATLEERVKKHKRKLEVHQSRVKFKLKNDAFELYINMFYKNLNGGPIIETSVPEKEIYDF